MLKYKALNIAAYAAITLGTLTGCGGNDSTVKKTETLPNINKASISLQSLKNVSSTTLETHIKNGLYQKSLQQDLRYTLETSTDSLANPQSSVTSANFSSTITQEQGVDEGDIIKYDGNFLYIANNKQDYYYDETGSSEQSSNTVKILQRDQQGELTKISETVVYDESSSINSMYLSGNILTVLSNVYNFTPYYSPISFSSEIFFPIEQKFNVSLVDVAETDSPAVTLSYTIDGSLLNSRRIDNTLYIVSSYTPYIEGVSYATTEEEKKANYNKINNTNINEFLPTYKNGIGDIRPLVNTSNCYLPKNTTELDGFEGIVTLTTIKIDQPNTIKSTCINAQVSGIYATKNSVYLYGTQYSEFNEKDFIEQSIIHKFAIGVNTLNYVASADLPGRFGWNNPSLRFSENNEYLRVITTEGDRTSGYHHKINILKGTSNSLQLSAQLPNDEHPTLIGKVNDEGITQEEIKAVRFFDDKAYVVTFLNTDPLYVIDLSNNESPVISGTLEIPGYSSYLHPISNNLMVGIGQNIDINRLTNTNITDETPIIEGAKISLFDVSDISNPTEINSIVYQGGYTPVEFDYHALTYLKTSGGAHRFALPIERWSSIQTTDSKTGTLINVWQPKNFLALLEITEPQVAPLLNEVGQIDANYNYDPINNGYISSWSDRSIIHNDDVYYIHGANVWKTHWLNSLEIEGPF